MKAKELFDIVGGKIAGDFLEYGFKYTKKWGAKKETKKYRYSISFGSFPGNTKNNISLSVYFIIEFIPLNEQLLHFNLWDLGYYYEVGKSHTIEQVCDDIIKHANNLLIPYIDIFEIDVSKYKNEWIKQGFTSHISSDYTTDGYGYWIGTNFLNDYNQFGFTISLSYMDEIFNKEETKKCLINYFKSLNKESQIIFLKACKMEEIGEPWDIKYQELPDVGKVRYAIDNSIKLTL